MKKYVALAMCLPLCFLVACGGDDDSKDSKGSKGDECTGSDCNPDKEPDRSLCANFAIDAGEECDGANLGGLTCAHLPGFSGGELKCSSECKFDTSACIEGMAYAGTYQMRATYDLAGVLPNPAKGVLNMLLDSAEWLGEEFGTALCKKLGCTYSSDADAIGDEVETVINRSETLSASIEAIAAVAAAAYTDADNENNFMKNV